MGGLQHQVGGFDLIYHNGAMVPDPASAYSTFLGCDIPRPETKPRKSTRTSSSTTSEDSSSNRKAGSGSSSARSRATTGSTAAKGRGSRKPRGRVMQQAGEEEEE